LPVVSSLSAKNISLFRLVETAIEPIPSRAHQEGRYASSRTWSAGCDGCRRCRKTSGAARGRRSRTVLTPRGRRQARGRFPRATESTKPGLRGDYEGNRNTIAQGMPECFGQPVVTMLVCFHLSRTRLREPGIPCALRFFKGDAGQNSGRSCRGNMGACPDLVLVQLIV
jgi:hypothetical protein